MTDRELLEMAAKTVGAEHNGYRYGENGREPLYGMPFEIDDGIEYQPWNPLEDDGDALRLAVALRLSIDHNHSADQQRWVAADRQGCEGCYSPVSCVEDEFDESQRDAATRRAVVRAAAEIGRAMP